MCNDLQLVLGCKRSTHLHVEIETKTRSTHRDLRQVQLFQPSCNKMQRGIYLSCVNYVIRKVSLRQQHPLMMEPERSVLPLTKCIKSARCHSECIFFFSPTYSYRRALISGSSCVTLKLTGAINYLSFFVTLLLFCFLSHFVVVVVQRPKNLCQITFPH